MSKRVDRPFDPNYIPTFGDEPPLIQVAGRPTIVAGRAPRKKRELKPCKPGQERNPLTNRCRKIKPEGVAKEKAPRKKRELKPCPPGSERNPATNRCRKIRAKKSPEVKKPTATEIRTVKKTKKMTPKTNPNYEERKGIKEQIVELSREYNEKYGRKGINKQYLTKENKEEFYKASVALRDQILSLIKEGGVEGWANFDDDASEFIYNQREFRGRVRRRMKVLEGKKPEGKKPTTTEIQAVKKTKKMVPKEIKSEEVFKTPTQKPVRKKKSVELVDPEMIEWNYPEFDEHPPVAVIKEAFKSAGLKFYTFKNADKMSDVLDPEEMGTEKDYYYNLWRYYKFVYKTRKKG